MQYKCPNCSAFLLFSDNKYTCEYCKCSFNINDLEISENIEVSYIIPFTITKNEVIKLYYKSLGSKLFVPKEFKNKNITNIIQGVYVPVNIYNFESAGVIELEGNLVNNFKSGKNKYKKIDVYKILRGASMNFKNMPITLSSKIDDDILLNIEPFDYKKLVKYDSSYIKDYKVYCADKNNIKTDLQNKAKKIFAYLMKNDIKEYSELKEINNLVNIYNLKSIDALIPIWLLDINYKEKVYMVAINGSTGKVSSNIPKDNKRIIYIWLILFMIIFMILLLIDLVRVI